MQAPGFLMSLFEHTLWVKLKCYIYTLTLTRERFKKEILVSLQQTKGDSFKI